MVFESYGITKRSHSILPILSARKLDKIVKKRNSDQKELLSIRGMLTDDTDSTGYTDESSPFFRGGLCLSCGAGGD